MIEGERVRLRPMEASDTGDVVRWRNDPEILSQLFSDERLTEEGHLRWLESVRARSDRQEFIIVEKRTGCGVGTVGLAAIDRANRRAEYGILVGEPDARGTGIGREASQLLLRYAFRQLGLNRVYLHAFADNEAALRLYRKVGFREEGTLRQHECKRGRFSDVVVMAILAEELE